MNYTELAKDFLIYKLHRLDTSRVKDNFDVINLENEIQKSKDIEELHTACKLIAKKGLKQISTLFLPLKSFYEYLQSKNESLLNVDTFYLEDYINKVCIDLDISFGYRSNYKVTLVAFLNYVDKDYKYEHKFNIGKFKVINTKVSTELIDWIDIKTLSKVNKEILKYPYKKNEELEKNRDILIFRLFCFSGILINEMANLTTKSFIFKDNMMYLKVEGNTDSKNREIPLPKEKLIRYYNRYSELRNPNAETFFCNKDGKKIQTRLLSDIVKNYLEFCRVDVRDKTPKMLRKTYALILNNEKDKDGFTQPEQNIKYLLGLANTTQLREILKYGTIDVVTASSVFENLDI